MSKQKICITLLFISLLSILRTAPAQAQVQGGGWSKPYRLSSDAGKSSEGYMVADQYGYVHCFWTETLFENSNSVLKYARFDGTTWTKPNDIYVTGQEIRNVSPVVDRQGTLHIAWSQGEIGIPYKVYYTYAPANNALSVQDWAKPIRIDVPARPVNLRVDSKGVFHILYINSAQEETGVYYVRSKDGGVTWSDPVWLDPNIRPGYVPDSLSFQLDENDGLHAAWWYGARDRELRPDRVTYIHSLDRGNTWSAPFIIDQYNEETAHYLTNASPIMIVQGQTVHIIWAAGRLPYRNHRFSSDAGRTWSVPVQIFGHLHGQAFDGFAVDGSGRVHYLGEIRYPIAIYHAYWNQTRWSIPSIVYLIAEEGSDETMDDRIQAHFTIPVIRAGNQLVLTFTDGPADPNRRLFVMYRTLDDIPPLETIPTPTPTVTPVQSPTPGQPTPMPKLTATVPSPESAEFEPLRPAPAPDLAIKVALIPTLLVIGVTMFLQLFHKHRR